MRFRWTKGRDSARLRLLGVIVMGISLSTLAMRIVDQNQHSIRETRFREAISRSEATLIERLRTYEQILRGGSGLFEASDAVTREEWRAYFDTLQLPLHYPGVLGLGFVRQLRADEIASYEAEQRRQGLSAFHVWPAGVRDHYSVITYVEPLNELTEVAFGYDMASSPVRQAAMSAARDSGQARMSAPVTLLHASHQPARIGMLIYMPVYRPLLPGAGVGARRGALLGYVYSASVADELMLGLLGAGNDDIQLRIEDIGDAAPAVLYSSAPDGAANEPQLQATRELSIYGRTWRLHFDATQQFGAEATPWSQLVLAGGLMVTLLLFFIVRAQRRATQRAHQLAHDMSQAYRDAEARQRAVVDSSAEGILTIDMRGIVLSFNRAAERMFGFRADEVLGRNVAMLMPERYRARHDQYVAEFSPREHGRIVGLRRDVTGLRRDGREFPMSLAINVIDGDGPRRFVGVIADISDAKASERALRESEERSRRMIEGVADYAIFMLDAHGKVSTWNTGATRIIGYSSDEIIGQHFSVFYPPDAQQQGLDDLQRAHRDGQTRDEGWRRRKDGSHFWAHSLLTAVRDEHGKLIGYSKIIRDLTEIHQVQAQLAEANSLRQSIVESAAFSIIATDIHGRIRSINPAAERLLWYRREDLVDKAGILQLHDRAELAERAAALSQELGERIEPGLRVLTAKAERGLADEHEWSYVRRDGSHVPVQLAMTALRDAREQISGYLGIAYDIVERKRHEAYIQHIAHHDALTGLPNRVLLQDRLHQAILRARRESGMVAVLMLDLDHFKRINDTLGHHVGDRLLLSAAERLKNALRSSDSVARMGGDEFVVLLPDLQQADQASEMAQKLLDGLAAPLVVGSHELQITASIGISVSPDDGIDGTTLLKNADTAMYQAKAAGRACHRRFSEEMLHAASRKLELEGAMRRALAQNEFRMHYEPQISLTTGTVVGMEALIRWSHPQRGEIAPGDFIPVAEESGLIVPIGEWTLYTACREAREIQLRLGLPLSVSVNLSPRQFAQPNLVEQVKAACEAGGLDPQHLVLELTEGTLMHKSDDAIAMLKRLRTMGISIAIDDFGVGYSSLAYITRFPIDQLKIDRSFVRDICIDAADAAIAQAIIAMAHGLDIRVVAEGVETQAQLDDLRRRACDGAQGHLFGPGSSADAFVVQGFHFSQAVAARDFPARVQALRNAALADET